MLLSSLLINPIDHLILTNLVTTANPVTSTDSFLEILTRNKIALTSLPLNISELLSHKEKMTLVLKEKKNLGNPIEIEVLSQSNVSNEYIRTVILKDERSQKVLSLGIVKIDLAQLKEYPQLVNEVKQAKIPFGQLLENHNLTVTGNPDTFYRINALDDKKKLFSFLTEKFHQAFDLNGSSPVYGRHNTLTRDDTQAKIAEVYEFLAI